MTDLGSLDDASVAQLFGEDDALRSWVQEALLAIPANADPGLLDDIRGTVCFELVRPGRAVMSQLARFGAGTVELLDEGAPDVTIGATAVRFVRLVTGQASAALLYLADELTVKGDELLALAVGMVIARPGDGVAVVDPTALDPVAVSRAIKDVSTAHLSDVMGGGLREVVLGEVFRRLPDFLDERKARNADLAIGFRIEGAEGRQADRYLVEVRHGGCVVTRGPDQEARRDVTLLLDGPGFLRLVLGHTNPVRAVMSGRLRLKGDPGKALAFNAVMRIPQP